jgi:DNA-binding NtrC family response regulator
VSSSQKAYNLFKKNPQAFDLVITDMTMPDITGDILASRLIKIRNDIPVILFTGYSRKISEEKAKQIGIGAFLYKPVVIGDMAKTIRTVLDEHARKTPPK